MKKFTTMIVMAVMVIIAASYTASHAGNSSNDKNNTNGHAYGHNKKQCVHKCDCQVDFDILVAAAKQALLEHEEEKAQQESNMKMTSPAMFVEGEEVDVETRRLIVHKVSDDATNNAGYYGFDGIGYTKDQRFADFVNNSTDGMTEAYVTIVNSFGDKITIKLDAYLSDQTRTDWDTFLTGRD